MNNFKNPENPEAILKQMTEIKTYEEFKNIIETTFPGWLIDSCDSYSNDYPHLNSNWKKICEMQNITMKKIVLVEEIFFNDNDYLLLNGICEILTRFGYCVRRKSEFIKCTCCGKAIPCEDIWKQFQNHPNIKIPKNWNTKCSNC